MEPLTEHKAYDMVQKLLRLPSDQEDSGNNEGNNQESRMNGLMVRLEAGDLFALTIFIDNVSIGSFQFCCSATLSNEGVCLVEDFFLGCLLR